MKRIALFSVTYDPFIGGAEIAIKEVTSRLAGYEFDLFTARLNVRLPRRERIGNVNVYRVGSGRTFLDKLLYPWRASRLAAVLHRQNPYDLIHAVLETYAGISALLFKKKEPTVPYLLTLQSGDSDWFIRLRTWFWYPWYRQVFTRADAITAISSWLAGRAQTYGARAEDIVIIPNAVDEHFLESGSPEERMRVRQSWGVDNSPPARGGDTGGEGDVVVITTSRLVRKNGIDILIDAMEYVPENVKLVIAGTGKDERSLKACAEKFRDRVLFLGHVGHDKLPELLRSADIFVRPSRSEGLGNAFLEAKAAGLVVMGTPVGGIKDLISAGIVEPVAEANAQGVAEKIKAVMSNPDSYRGGSDARTTIKEQYTWDVIAGQYAYEYRTLLKQDHVPRR